jgi:hypothetical protein
MESLRIPKTPILQFLTPFVLEMGCEAGVDGKRRVDSNSEAEKKTFL